MNLEYLGNNFHPQKHKKQNGCVSYKVNNDMNNFREIFIIFIVLSQTKYIYSSNENADGNVCSTDV
jgi:uncharacterized MAPEG superfamily protein